MWGLDYKESWVLTNWCFWTVVLEKTLESPLDCKEIQAVHPKEDQSWVFIGRTDAKAETPVLWPLMQRADSLEKSLMLGRLKAGGEGDDRGWDGWMASPTQWTWVWWTLGVGDGQGGLVCCSSWGHKESDTTELLNWTELTGREHSPAHQQNIGLKIYWAWLCTSEQDPISKSVSLSHQEASISFLFSSMRGQTDWKPQAQKTNQSDNMDHSLVLLKEIISHAV